MTWGKTDLRAASAEGSAAGAPPDSADPLHVYSLPSPERGQKTQDSNFSSIFLSHTNTLTLLYLAAGFWLQMSTVEKIAASLRRY